MKIKAEKNYRVIILAGIFSCCFYLLIEFYFTQGRMGVPLDDTWIHFQFADNFAKGHFFQYNIGEPAAGTTSPLYVIILGTVSLVIPNFILSSVLISSVFYLLCCLITYKISLIIFKSKDSSLHFLSGYNLTPEFFSLLVSLLTIFAGRFAWSGLSGMETTIFTFFCLAGVLYYLKDTKNNKFTLTPTLLLALASVTRPEGFLLYSIYIVLIYLNCFKVKDFKVTYSKLIISLILFASITLPYFIFSYSLSGNFLPNTFRGQGGSFTFIPDLHYLSIALTFFLRDNFITGFFFILAALYYFYNIKKYFNEQKYMNIIFMWIIFLPLISSIVIPNWRHHVRYLIPLIPFLNIAAVYYLAILLNSKYFINFKKSYFTSRSITLSFLMISFIYYIVFAIELGKNTDNINNQQVKLGSWVRDNVSSDETIAVNDIGAIKFISRNRILDLEGLVTPEILRYRTYQWKDNLDSTFYLLKKNNVSYIIIYDEWFKEFLEKFGNELTLVTSARLEDNTICGGDEMKVYKTNFKNKKD